MTHPPQIPPALSKEQWESSIYDDANGLSVTRYQDGDLGFYGDLDGGGIQAPEQRHALAALCLYGQSYGFSKEDVELLSRIRDGFVRGNDGVPDSLRDEHELIPDEIAFQVVDWRRLLSLIRRIQALLPPEGSSHA